MKNEAVIAHMAIHRIGGMQRFELDSISTFGDLIGLKN